MKSKKKWKKKLTFWTDLVYQNEAYHEFTKLQDNEAMIRSYIVEECQADYLTI